MSKRVPRGSLTRDAIVDAALKLADREQFEAVTMRAIAADLGASPMALYAHFADKDALCDAMRSAIVDRTFRTEGVSTWAALLDSLARGTWMTARAHPNWLPLLMRPARPSESAIEVVSRLVELMAQDGFTLEQTLQAYVAATSYGVGFSIVERTTMQAAKRWALVSPTLPRLPRYASIAAVAQELDAFRADDAFELALRSLIASLQAKAARPKKARHS